MIPDQGHTLPHHASRTPHSPNRIPSHEPPAQNFVVSFQIRKMKKVLIFIGIIIAVLVVGFGVYIILLLFNLVNFNLAQFPLRRISNLKISDILR